MIRAANAELIDFTKTLEYLCSSMLSESCSVVLDERQYPVLLAFLQKVAAIGGINFRLEMCIDHRPGYSVSWDHDGDAVQEEAVNKLMDQLIQSLGFDAADIYTPQWIANPADVLNGIHWRDAQAAALKREAMAILDEVPSVINPVGWDRTQEDEDVHRPQLPDGT